MLKKIGIGVVAVTALLVVVVALQPAEFRIERSVNIAAAPALVFAMIDDFKVWDTWSPWAKLDPVMKKTWSGAAHGRGSIYEWSGNKDVGSGRMEITDVRDNEKVTIKLHFLAPFEASNTAEFTLTPAGNGTTVTWAMIGRNGFMGKAVGLVMNMDKLIGSDFDKGLAELKRLAEARAAS